MGTERGVTGFKILLGLLLNPRLLSSGRRGAVISKLRDQHGVNIQVPPSGTDADDEKSNQIRLIGYEANCMQAKEAIETIIRDLVRTNTT